MHSCTFACSAGTARRREKGVSIVDGRVAVLRTGHQDRQHARRRPSDECDRPDGQLDGDSRAADDHADAQESRNLVAGQLPQAINVPQGEWATAPAMGAPTMNPTAPPRAPAGPNCLSRCPRSSAAAAAAPVPIAAHPVHTPTTLSASAIGDEWKASHAIVTSRSTDGLSPSDTPGRIPTTHSLAGSPAAGSESNTYVIGPLCRAGLHILDSVPVVSGARARRFLVSVHRARPSPTPGRTRLGRGDSNPIRLSIQSAPCCQLHHSPVAMRG
jgi:hypothetical protein